MLPAGESEFAVQFEQTAAPTASLNLPAAHARHVPPLGPVNPALQMQALLPVLPEAESEFDVQFEQSASPISFLYWPVEQDVQDEPSGPENPLSHLQAVIAELPSTDTELCGHAVHSLVSADENVLMPQVVHTSEATAPNADELLPASHCVHAAAPTAFLYLPASHA